MDRRAFLRGTIGAALAAWPAEASVRQSPPQAAGRWDPGRVRHLLPTVSGSRMLVKASFAQPITSTPTLRVGSLAVVGRMNDTAGECWQFHATGLDPARRYRLALTAADGSSLCEPWDLTTLPSPDARPDRCRILFFTCAGGAESDSLTAGNLPTSVRNRLLRRGLAFAPDAAVANGDHVYWDLHAPRAATGPYTARSKSFDRSSAVFGTTNEAVLKRAAGPQIVPVYGTDFRSTPVFFLQDDHDHFDNDEGTDVMVTFPPPWFQIQLARATQQLYYPEFLPDASRPANLPWSSSSERGELSESFGTLRYGRLAEVLLYDVRRTMTLAGPTAVFVDAEVEKWLQARTTSSEAAHVVHAPSNPFGWSAGKWGEWYPDVLGSDGRLTTARPKPYWQSGWLAQHDRLVQAIASARRATRLVVSGDLHAIALGRIGRIGTTTLQAAPVTTILSGPIGTRPEGWPSAVRGVAPTAAAHLDVEEAVRPLEQHGFTLVDFFPDRLTVRLFRWDVKTMTVDAIDRLEPFYTTELAR
ncbi:MAG: alkaline phosphatase D family protein [Acidobacteriota bacterium]